MNSNCWKALAAISVLLMTACSEAPMSTSAPAASDTSAPPTPVSGKTAFYAMYKTAYSWSNDIVPLKLESKDLPGIKNDGGTAGMWTATFGSPTKHSSLEITYAVAPHAPDIGKGINTGHPVPWAGPTRDVMPFQSSDFVVDSDAAYKTALGDANAWVAKHPDKEAELVLGNDPTHFTSPVWSVLWGDKKSGYLAFVNATSGSLEKAKK